MAIIICNSSLVNNSTRKECTQTVPNWCCSYCFNEECNERCYYDTHAIDCRTIKKEE